MPLMQIIDLDQVPITCVRLPSGDLNFELRRSSAAADHAALPIFQ